MAEIALILVGGKGSRLKSVVADRPKPLAKVHDKNFLELLLEQLVNLKLEKIVLLAGYRADFFFSFMSEWNKKYSEVPVEVVVEDKALGTAGAIRYGITSYPAYESYLVLNGDTYYDGNLSDLVNKKVNRNCPIYITYRLVSDISRYGGLDFENGRLSKWNEKLASGEGYVNAGIYLVHRSIVEYINEDQFVSFEKETLPQILEKKEKSIFCVELERAFYDIGIPESYGQFVINYILSKEKTSTFFRSLLVAFLRGGSIYLDSSLSEKTIRLLTELSDYFYLENIDVSLHKYLPSNGDVLIVDREENEMEEYRKNTGLAIFSFASYRKPGISVNCIELESIENLLCKLKNVLSEVKAFKYRVPTFVLPSRKGLFLDRDGVVIEFVDYISEAKDVRLKDDAVSLIKLANKENIPVFIVTNQSGIGKEYFEHIDYFSVDNEMKSQLAAKGCFVDQVSYAAYYESGDKIFSAEGANYRKPGNAMIQEVAQKYLIDLSKSIMVGDRYSDILCGVNSGVKYNYLLRSSWFKEEEKILNDMEVTYNSIDCLSLVELV